MGIVLLWFNLTIVHSPKKCDFSYNLPFTVKLPLSSPCFSLTSYAVEFEAKSTASQAMGMVTISVPFDSTFSL